MKLLQNKNVIITGASRGIGKRILEIFVENGANVAFSYIGDSEQAKSIEKEFSNHKQKVVSYMSDASNFEQSQKLVDNVPDLDTIPIFPFLNTNPGIIPHLASSGVITPGQFGPIKITFLSLM